LRQFDVFENPNSELRLYAPFLVILQSHHLQALDTTVVAPLIDDARRPLSGLDIPVEFGTRALVIAVTELAAIDGRHLQRPVGNLAAHEDPIRRALDRIFTGF